MRRTRVRLAEREPAGEGEAPPLSASRPVEDSRRAPLSIGTSLLIWAVMAALAWGVVVLALRWL